MNTSMIHAQLNSGIFMTNSYPAFFSGESSGYRISNTRARFAKALISLAQTKKVAKITVGEICNECGLSRGSFYKNFYDKYELIDWIYESELERILYNVRGHERRESTIEHFSLWLQFFKTNQKFLANALEDPAVQGFCFGLLRLTIQFMNEYTKKVLNTAELSPLVEYQTKFYSYGVVYMMGEWLHNGAKEDVFEVASRLVSCMPSQLAKELYRPASAS